MVYDALKLTLLVTHPANLSAERIPGRRRTEFQLVINTECSQAVRNHARKRRPSMSKCLNRKMSESIRRDGIR